MQPLVFFLDLENNCLFSLIQTQCSTHREHPAQVRHRSTYSQSDVNYETVSKITLWIVALGFWLSTGTQTRTCNTTAISAASQLLFKSSSWTLSFWARSKASVLSLASILRTGLENVTSSWEFMGDSQRLMRVWPLLWHFLWALRRAFESLPQITASGSCAGKWEVGIQEAVNSVMV